MASDPLSVTLRRTARRAVVAMVNGDCLFHCHKDSEDKNGWCSPVRDSSPGGLVGHDQRGRPYAGVAWFPRPRSVVVSHTCRGNTPLFGWFRCCVSSLSSDEEHTQSYNSISHKPTSSCNTFYDYRSRSASLGGTHDSVDSTNKNSQTRDGPTIREKRFLSLRRLPPPNRVCLVATLQTGGGA